MQHSISFILAQWNKETERTIKGRFGHFRSQQGEQKKEWTEHVRKGIEALQEWLSEGCIGQIAEIYDGGMPTVSRGCFAQAWSVGELLRAVWEWEQF